MWEGRETPDKASLHRDHSPQLRRQSFHLVHVKRTVHVFISNRRPRLSFQGHSRSKNKVGLVYWGVTPQQQPESYEGGEMMMMKSVFWWRKPEYPEETTDLRQVTDETFHTYSLCPVRGLNLGRSSMKQSELRRDESDALSSSPSYSHQSVGVFQSLRLHSPHGDDIGR